eukprot:Hpha_TRINITY_DN33234_c0_g1::TRINITY_DN33234_c0_g1_i1::g.186301::m.186301
MWCWLHASPLTAPGGESIEHPDELSSLRACIAAAPGPGRVAVAHPISVGECLRSRECRGVYLSAMTCDQVNLWLEDEHGTGGTRLMRPCDIIEALQKRPAGAPAVELVYLPFCWSDALSPAFLEGGARCVVAFEVECGERGCEVTDVGARGMG